MKSVDKFDLVGPLDYRYISEKERKDLAPYLSENARVFYQAKVEAAIVDVLSDYGVCSKKIAKNVKRAASLVKAEAVYAEERIIKHDVRALVNVMRSKVANDAKPFIHFSATSYDIVDSSNSARYKDAVEKVLLPELLRFEKLLIKLALKHKNALQIGRTHGQHAEPITFGFTLAEYVARLGDRIEKLKQINDELYGKFSGAVGCYNAQSLLLKNPVDFEKKLMKKLGLKVAPFSTQIVMPEAYEDLQHTIISCFTVLANFSDDMRNLQRSEINEIAEAFSGQQVGSSTMPHKRNPINFENVKSFWKQFMPRMITAYMDGISDHQRDLTNSASQRFIQEIIVGLYLSTKRLNKVCKNLVVDSESMKANFDCAKNKVVAEPLYILLAKYGHKDAHEKVRKLTLEADADNELLVEVVMHHTELIPYLKKFSKKELAIINNPENYTGLAAEKTGQVCFYWKKKLKL